MAISYKFHPPSSKARKSPLSNAASCYLVWGKFPFVSNHPSQTGHRAKQRHSQPDPQIPLSFGAEHQNHTQQPATKKRETQSGMRGNKTPSTFSLVLLLTVASSTARKGQKKTFMNKSVHFNINNRSLGLSFYVGQIMASLLHF